MLYKFNSFYYQPIEQYVYGTTHSPVRLYLCLIHSHISLCHRNFQDMYLYVDHRRELKAFRVWGVSVAFDYCWLHQHKHRDYKCWSHSFFTLSSYFFSFLFLLSIHFLSFNISILQFNAFLCSFVRAPFVRPNSMVIPLVFRSNNEIDVIGILIYHSVSFCTVLENGFPDVYSDV